MKRFFKGFFALALICLTCINLVACGDNARGSNSDNSEKIELSTSVLNEVEFENSEAVKLEQKENNVVISGNIDAMSKSQKNAFGVDNVDHVVIVKLTFNREKTVSSFTIKGDVTKVYSDDETDENYVGKLSELLDNEQGEDAYCELILSAKTKEYKLTSKYSDKTENTITITINATLSSSKSE